MARKKYRKKRISAAADEVWHRHMTDIFGRWAGPWFGRAPGTPITTDLLLGVAANYSITVDELRIALAPLLLQERLDKAMEG